MLIIIMLLEDKRWNESGSINIIYLEAKETFKWNSWNNTKRERANKVKNSRFKAKSASNEKHCRFRKFYVKEYTLVWC